MNWFPNLQPHNIDAHKKNILASFFLFAGFNSYAPKVEARPEPALTQIVQNIISYSRWTPTPRLIQLCVIDDRSQYSASFKTLERKGNIVVSNKSSKYPNLAQKCNVLFFDQTSPRTQQNIINLRGNNEILSLSMNNQACAIGSTFCIYRINGVLNFNVNLDSLSRSGIKVNPNVLMLAKPQK